MFIDFSYIFLFALLIHVFLLHPETRAIYRRNKDVGGLPAAFRSCTLSRLFFRVFVVLILMAYGGRMRSCP